MTAEQAVLLGVEDGVATISLNRPERLNAMSDELMSESEKVKVKVKDERW